MGMTLQQVSDRFEIEDMLVEYCHIIDTQDFDRLDEIFVEDAWIDYTATGGMAGNLETIKAFLKKALPAFRNTQHMIANYRIRIDGDRASGRIMCFNPMEFNLPDKGNPVFFLGLWYVDEYVRTPSGWRISRRTEEKSYAFNTPSFMNPK
jgi:3-phenylpropionate/cinnamic acid dioxygenase small subunit